MIVAFKGNYSGMILLEELKEERLSWEADERAWAGVLAGHGLSQGQDRSPEKTGCSPFWHFFKYFQDKCLLLRSTGMLL